MVLFRQERMCVSSRAGVGLLESLGYWVKTELFTGVAVRGMFKIFLGRRCEQ